jgi:uncharacterized protein (TIGR00297 family)
MLVLPDAANLALAQRVALGAIIATAIALLGYRARALSASGAIAAVAVGALAFGFGRLLVAAAIVIFFVTGSLLTRFDNATADAARSLAPKTAQRDWAQVVANGGVATACTLMGAIAATRNWPFERPWMIAAVCAVAAVSGDTWSTEIGALFRGSVRMITTLRTVAAGTSGGITPVGIIAAPVGGAFVAFAGAARPDLLSIWTWLALGALAGLVGSTFDSVLGATVQGVWRCARCGQTTESKFHAACGGSATLVRGLRWLDNDGVNGLASLSGAALGFVVGSWAM